MIRTVFGRTKSGTALIPFFDSTSVSFGISTRNGNTVVDWGDGSSSNIAPVKMRDFADGSAASYNFNKSYSSALNGNVSVKFLHGLKDVYSIYLGTFHDTGTQKSKLNILDVETFFHQFPNLFSLCIDEYAYQTTARMSVIKGDLAKLPNSVERVLIENAEILNAQNDFVLNLSNYTNSSKLRYFNFTSIGGTLQSTMKIIGDLSKIPNDCEFFYLAKGSSESRITYSSSKVWKSAFDTLYIPLSLGTFICDNILTDMSNYITSSKGNKIITIYGWITSDQSAKISYLTALGFTVSATLLNTSTGSATSTTQKFSDDIANIPSTVPYFKILNAAVGSHVTYTSGKVWKSAFDTFYLPISVNPYDGDNILIDMKNSITSAVGGKVIYFNGGRTSASDSAVTYLTGLGFNVNGMTKITPAKILDLPLQNSFVDVSPSGISMVAGNANGFPSFVSDGSGGYALDFGGTKSIKTSVNLPINTSDKVSIEFDIKTSATAAQVVMELSPNYGLNNSFGIFLNDTLANRIEIADRNSGVNIGNSAVNINDGIFHHVKMVIDRSLGINQNKIYIDGVLSYVQSGTYYTNNNGNFGSFTLFIGQRNGSSLGFVGQMKNLKIYNYPIL